MLIQYLTQAIELDNIETFYKLGEFQIYFLGISKNFHYYTFKTSYLRDYNFQRILDSYGMCGILHLDEKEEEIIDELC